MLLFGNYEPLAIVAIAIVLFFGMGWHEYAHAVMATWWGDPTPRQHGRLTPNPIVHINWIGWLMFLLIGFGILGSVPINPRLMRDGKWGQFWTSLAGPLSNLVQAGVFTIVIRVLDVFSDAILIINGATPIFRSELANKVVIYNGSMPQIVSGEVSNIWYFLALLCYFGVVFNVLLFVFNLLPFFPMDGWWIVLSLLPGYGVNWKSIPLFLRENLRPVADFIYQPAYKWQQWAQITQYIFFGLLMISFVLPNVNILGLLISQPTFTITRFLLGA